MRILFISPPILNGSGGEVIRKRNKEFLISYVGKENLFHYPLAFYAYYDINNKTLIENDLKNIIENFKPDLIYMDNSLMAIPDFIFEHKTMVFFHNVEAIYAKQDKNINEHMLQLIYDNERYIAKKANYIVCINQRDNTEIKRLYGRECDYILPISFKDNYIKNNNNKTKGEYMLFVGTDFYGNTDGLFWFIDNCLDKINSRLIVAGKGMDKYNGKFNPKKVTFLGYVQDISILYANASCVVLPIISGSGMKTKTCEAFMYAKKCFGTKEAFEGYVNVNEASATYCENAEEFVTKINEYLKSEYSVNIDEARNYFLNNYEDEIVKKKYYNFLKEQVKI